MENKNTKPLSTMKGIGYAFLAMFLLFWSSFWGEFAWDIMFKGVPGQSFMDGLGNLLYCLFLLAGAVAAEISCARRDATWGSWGMRAFLYFWYIVSILPIGILVIWLCVLAFSWWMVYERICGPLFDSDDEDEDLAENISREVEEICESVEDDIKGAEEETDKRLNAIEKKSIASKKAKLERLKEELNALKEKKIELDARDFSFNNIKESMKVDWGIGNREAIIKILEKELKNK